MFNVMMKWHPKIFWQKTKLTAPFQTVLVSLVTLFMFSLRDLVKHFARYYAMDTKSNDFR